MVEQQITNLVGAKVGAEQILCSNNARHTQQDQSPGHLQLLPRTESGVFQNRGPSVHPADRGLLQRVGVHCHVSSGFLVLSGQASRASRSLADAGAAGIPPLALCVCLVLPALRNGSWCALCPALGIVSMLAALHPMRQHCHINSGTAA